MIDEIIKKHNMEEQELVKSCEALSDSEKTQMIHMLDRALESTNGHLTDERVKFIAENTENLAKVISGLFRKTATENLKHDQHIASMDMKMQTLTDKVDTLSTKSEESDDKIVKSLSDITKELKDLQLKSAERDGKEHAKTGDESSTQAGKNAFMKWVENNQFFIFLILMLIAVQGGNIGKFIMGFFKSF